MTQSFNSDKNLTNLVGVNSESYLVFVYGKSREDYAVSEFTPKQKQEIQNNQNLLSEATSGIETGVAGKIGMALWTSPVVQNLANKQLSNATLSRVNSSLYDIMADGKVSLVEVGEDLIGNCTNILDNMATDLGFPSPSGLYSAIMPGGTGVPSKDFANLFAKKAEQENQEIKQKQNEQLNTNNEILKFRLVTKDSENWTTDIPTRKTEKGMYLSPVLGNQNLTKSYSISIVNNPNKGISMYQERDKLYSLRDKKVKFDIYVYDSDVREIRSFNNCVFSNISIDTEGRNSLVLDLSITQIPEYEIKIDTNLDKDIKKSTGANTTGKKKPSKDSKTKSTPKNVQTETLGKKYSQTQVNGYMNDVQDAFNEQQQKIDKASGIFKNKIIQDAKNEQNRLINDATKILNQDVNDVKGWRHLSTKEVKTNLQKGTFGPKGVKK